jgi:DNA repair exonuclease SbcCD ATPase subunit
VSLHIIELTVRDFKGISAVAINAEGKSLVQITGKGSQGKTSVLDAIWAALGGRLFSTGTASEKTTKQIREGADSAYVRVDLGEMVVTRTWDKNGPGKLTVTSARGATYNSPQGVLDELLGQFAFDIMAFAKMTESQQIATLVDVIRDDLPFDPDALERERADVFDQRKTEKQILAKRKAAVREGWEEEFDDVPDERILVADGLAEKREIDEFNAGVLAQRRRNAELNIAAGAAGDRVTDGEEKLAAARRQLKTAELELADLNTALGEAVAASKADNERLAEIELLDDTRVLAVLASIDDVNSKVDEKLRLRAADAAVVEQEAVVDALEIRLEAIGITKAEGLKKAKLPYPDLSFDETGVTLKGIPFKQVSETERVLASAALAMAMDPELRVLRIDGGEALDSDGLKALEALAKNNDYQLWISRVSEAGDGDVVIFDGAVAS